MRKFIVCIICAIICSGCVDIMGVGDIGIIDTVSVNPKGPPWQIALCIDEDIYVTDPSGSTFTRVTENDLYNGAVSWAEDGLLYTEDEKDIWILKKDSEVILQEMNRIAVPILAGALSYVVLKDEDELFGSINIYEKDTSRIYTVLLNAYYDYEWIPGTRRIAAISVSSTNPDTFNGVLLIKDIDSLLEEVIFNGTFKPEWDYIDIVSGNNIIFSSDGEIYLYNISEKELSKWQGPDGYDYRLPPSINSSLKGYILAKVKGVSEGWSGQLYLVPPDGGFISIPGWPLWMNESIIVCMDSSSGDVLVKKLERNEIVNLTEKFYGPRNSFPGPRNVD